MQISIDLVTVSLCSQRAFVFGIHYEKYVNFFPYVEGDEPYDEAMLRVFE